MKWPKRAFFLYPSFSAVENLRYLAILAKLELSDSAIQEAMLQAGLKPERIVRKVGDFSKGIRQKVAIAFMLLKQAKLILMDEPTSG